MLKICCQVKYRKNAVLAVENLLTASPEFFKGKSDLQVREWADESIQSMRKFWGNENIASATLHLDESTPHIHLYAIPLIEGKLNCREFLGGRKKLSDMQSHYANSMKKFDLERGVLGSRATHKTMKDLSTAAQVETPKLKVKKYTVLTKHESKLFGADEVETKEIKIPSLASAKAVLAQAKSVPLLRAKNKNLSDHIVVKDKLIRKLKSEAELSFMRATPLVDIAEKFGFIQDEKDKSVWVRDTLKVSINEPKFYDFKTGKGGGGAIDFVMYAEDTDFKNAVQLLSFEISPECAMRSVAQRQVRKCAQIIENPKPKVCRPVAVPFYKPDLFKWLNEVRAIPIPIIQNWWNKGLVYASSWNDGWQAIWKQSDNAYLRENPNTGFKGWVAGSNVEPLFIRDKNKRPAIVESHIDAMSLQALNPHLTPCIAARCF
ncbi:MAG: MobV family relaxase [Ghiorsea sp.]|nr:MobV family relaxase [Ghiorsea sp.]